jgi:hypothetical protein
LAEPRIMYPERFLECGTCRDEDKDKQPFRFRLETYDGKPWGNLMREDQTSKSYRP